MLQDHGQHLKQQRSIFLSFMLELPGSTFSKLSLGPDERHMKLCEATQSKGFLGTPGGVLVAATV